MLIAVIDFQRGLDDLQPMSDAPQVPSRSAARNRFRIHLQLARRPLFCCCCIALTGDDALRLMRVLALTRAIKKSWR